MKTKRLSIRLDEDVHKKFMIWCRENGISAQMVGENLIKGLLNSDSYKKIEGILEKN
jgi:hypothetical protein